MRYLLSIFLVSLALVMMPQSLVAYQTKVKYQSKAYNAGRAATIIEDACGRYELSEKLYLSLIHI